MARGVTALVLAGAAAILLLPSLIFGTLISHSSPQNLTWAAQFAEQFRAGILYPRWMPESFDGLGSPAFYFYPPLPFWTDALVSVITANLMPVPYRLAVTSTLILFASGLAMHAWLKAQTGNAKAALWGALAYMAAPYHLLDLYKRGAFAECTAFVFLPLVLLSLRRPVPLALAYAGLLLSHLPSALLVSVTVLPAYALARAPTPAELAKMIAGGTLGIVLASAYLLPAMTLQGWISADQLWTALYRPERWFMFSPALWPDPIIMRVIACFAIAYALAAGAVMLAFRHYFWAGVSFACLVLIAGVVPWFWEVPELAKVQFPWRLMLVVEFATITAIVTGLCTVSFASMDRPRLYLFVLAFLALVPGLVLTIADIPERVQYALRHAAPRPQDVKEYLPRGYPQAPQLSYAELGLEPVKDVPLISCAPPATTCEATPLDFGALSIKVDTDRITSVTLRRFFFPAWRIVPEGAIAPTPDFRLVCFSAEPGRHNYRLERAPLTIERWGWAISGLALLVLMAWAAMARRARPTA